jgi:hypothetical protein
MKTLVPLLALAVVFFSGCGENAPTAQEVREGAREGVEAPTRYVGANIRAQQQAQVTSATTTVNSAIRMFQAAEGRNPRDLNELIQAGYLGTLPELPRGASFHYTAQTGAVTVVGY